MYKITQEDLVRYMYNETSAHKTALITAALDTDWNLKETYEKLQCGKQNLNEIHHSPRPETVNKILEYAAKKQKQVHVHTH